jgi:hypothetical protein
MSIKIARTLVVGAMLFAAAACGYDTSTTFNADGSVTVGMKILFPKSLMQGSTGASMTGFGPADIAKANTQLGAKYPGAKISNVTEGDEVGALITVPFKNEKDAFAFLTQPSQLSPSSAASGSSSIDLSNTGGLFASASHTTSGQIDTYTFTTQPQPLTSPSPDSTSPITADELASIFTITFSLTVPHVITSAQGALFTLDRKTAIWKLSLTTSQNLTATTGPDTALALTGSNGSGTGNGSTGQSPILLLGVALVAIVIGFVIGMFSPLRRSPGLMPAPGAASLASYAPAPQAPSAEEPAMVAPNAWPGPPSGAPPPPNSPGS